MKKILILSILISTYALSHPGRLDSSGGHWNRKTGTYHYHRATSSSYNSNSTNSTTSKSTKTVNTKSTVTQPKKTTIKKPLMSEDEIYTRLTFLRYTGPNAIQNFQRDYGLTADGIAGPKTIQILRQKTDGLI